MLGAPREREAHHIVYRRRADNAGYKAGNVRDFCEMHGRDFELMLPLDADSLMTGDAIVSLVRIMQAHPKIGILQSLVVGMPSSSPFARIFQFGMRFGMRSYTMGQAWWVGDCGPFWGHNALVRIAPFLRRVQAAGYPRRPALRRACALARSGRGDADAPRRIRSARHAGRGRELRGEPARRAGIHPPRRALVPGQYAVCEAARSAGTEDHQPFSARSGRF